MEIRNRMAKREVRIIRGKNRNVGVDSVRVNENPRMRMRTQPLKATLLIHLYEL
jgi:hypothetical protein